MGGVRFLSFGNAGPTTQIITSSMDTRAIDIVGGQLMVSANPSTGELTAVSIKPGTVDGGDADDLADLGDMVVAAYRDAKAKADAMADQTLGPLAGGLPGMGGPGGAPGPLGF